MHKYAYRHEIRQFAVIQQSLSPALITRLVVTVTIDRVISAALCDNWIIANPRI